LAVSASDPRLWPSELLVPAPHELLAANPVSTAVNSVPNDGPDLIVEATTDQLVS
jgi:hypothetical protein